MPSDLQTEVATATSSDLLHLASCSDYIMVVCEITEPRNFKAKRNMKIISPVLKFSPKEEIEGQSYKVTAQSYGAMSREGGDRSLVLGPCASPHFSSPPTSTHPFKMVLLSWRQASSSAALTLKGFAEWKHWQGVRGLGCKHWLLAELVTGLQLSHKTIWSWLPPPSNSNSQS